MPSKTGLTPDDQKCFDLLESLLDEDMVEAVFNAIDAAVQRLIAEGKDPTLMDQIDDRRAELEPISDDLVRLPDGGFAQLYYELRPVAADQVQEYTGMTLEQCRQERERDSV